MSLERDHLRSALGDLARQGVYLGTSSWKYAGWCGSLYDESRYRTRGKFSESRFDKTCLTEYGETFKTVCVDAAYYKFPQRGYLETLVSAVPEEFLFTFKVTDEITLKRFTRLPRFGSRGGERNTNFLNPDLFQSAFLAPCAAFQKNIGLLMFEFSHFYPSDFERGRDFVEALDRFLEALPGGWRYGVEIRNKNFLQPEYFSMLSRHGVAHIYNNWSDMPSVGEQMEIPGSDPADGVIGARFLLKPGRRYEEAVKLFSPYGETREALPEARQAGFELISRALRTEGRRKLFLYVNNRLEGNALETIRAMIKLLEISRPRPG